MLSVDAIARLISRFGRYQMRFALVGGYAVGVYGTPRFTKDIDFTVAVDSDSQAEQILRVFLEDGFRIDPLLVHKEHGTISTARLFLPESRSRSADFDLLFSFCGVESEIVAAAQPVEILPGLTVPVATLVHLIALKVLSERATRPNDRADLAALLGRSGQEEVLAVKKILALIEKRGFGSGQELLKKFDRLVRTLR